MNHPLLTWLHRPLHRAITLHLAWLWRVTSRRPGVLLAGTGLLLALSLASIATLRFEADIFKLFPTSQGPLKLFLDSLEWSGSAREAYFLLEGERQQLIPEAERFAGRLKSLQIDGQPAFTRVTFRIYDQAEAGAFAAFVGYAAGHPQLFLEPAAAAQLAERLTPTAMDGALQRAGTELASQAGMGLRELITADPLALRELILPRLKKGSQALDLATDSPYFLSRDGRVLIIIAEPARPVQEMAFARKLVAAINQLRREARVQVSCAGAHLSAVIDEQAMKGNVIASILSSLAVVIAIFFMTYRRLLPTLLLPLLIACGVVLALGTAGLFLPSIHIISFAFMALIVGIGTDYSIHIYDRYYAERAAGVPPDEALRLTITNTGHGVFTAATTTALPFLALMISDVRALSELGLLVGLGVIFSMYATFFFLPPLLLFMERRFPLEAYRPLPGFGLGRIWRATRRHPRLVRAGSLLLVVALLIACFGTRFEGELKNLQPRHSEALLTQEKIERHLSLSPRQLLVAVEGRDLEDVLARGGRVGLLLERYAAEKKLVAYSALTQLLNDQARQQAVAGELAVALGGRDPAADLAGALRRQGFAPAAFREATAGLATLRSPRPVPTAEAIARLSASPLRAAVDRHLVHDGNGYHLLFHVFYAGSELPREAFLHDLSAIDPTARATGADLVSDQLAASVKRSFVWGFALGGVLVLVLLIAHFTTPAGLFYSLYPVAAGVVAMLGTMALTGTRINFMNAMVLVTILGMGSDYGLHVGFRVSGPAVTDPEREFIQSGRAVLLSALTTIAGFGSLAFTDYGALASIGTATNYGVGATTLFALVSLPAFMRLPATSRES